ncbi:hypothetical protein BYT27DRAFT_6376523 [Phlegmacium glaucopus]|nr:hypothetical protein BYT27DRAFT_6376523 [Phlegmacium glaucopus]
MSKKVTNPSMQFIVLTSTIISALTLFAAASPASVVSNLVTVEEFKDWLAHTDAKLTFIGEPIDKRNALNTIVTYCNRRTFNVCGGDCTVYNGGPKCLDAHDTQCLSATANVGFCSSRGCTGDCNQFSTCGTRLDNNFCYTPGTASILVGNA